MANVQKITPHLWFDHQAEEAARFYVSVFRDAKLGRIAHYPEAGQEIHHQPKGKVMTVEFEIEGQPFLALNGGPIFKFNESISFVIHCKNQEEIDYYWEKLGEDGDPAAQQCGWLKDKYGLSWQVVPANIGAMMTHPDPAVREQGMSAVMKMKKFDMNELQRIYNQ